MFNTYSTLWTHLAGFPKPSYSIIVLSFVHERLFQHLQNLRTSGHQPAHSTRGRSLCRLRFCHNSYLRAHKIVMPRHQGQRPSREAAVSASPLFDLPLEIRWMIYKLLLVQDHGLAIAHDVFKRIKPRRDITKPPRDSNGPPRKSNRPDTCTGCGIFFTNRANLAAHGKSDSHKYWSIGRIIDPVLPDLPNMDTQILHICRLVHDEATPILYQFNSFCFSDPDTADAFRGVTDTKYTCLIQEISFNCSITYRKQRYPGQWKHLSQTFPQLKRMSIRLNTPLDCWGLHYTDSQLEEIARHFRGLDWVHVQGPRSVRILEMLYPIVERDSETGLMHVQKHITDAAVKPQPTTFSSREIQNERFRTMVDATLWWGHDGEQAPESSRHMR